MKHRLLKLGVFLLLGAIINVAVAWGCVVLLGDLAHTGHVMYGTGLPPDAIWLVELRTQPGAALLESMRWRNGPRESIWGSNVGPDPNDWMPNWMGFKQPTNEYESGRFKCEFRIADARGWPMISMWSEPVRQYHNADDRPPLNIAPQGGLPIPLPPMPIESLGITKISRMLPFRLIWPGFAINTIFYAAIVWLMFFIPGRLRRWRRIRRDLCPACAYPIGSSDVCTECGEPVA